VARNFTIIYFYAVQYIFMDRLRDVHLHIGTPMTSHINIMSCIRSSVTNNNELWIRRLDLLVLSLQLPSIMTAHNQ
jgi:hypothetical protein